MASGFKRKRGNDEYVFIDGQAMRAEEAVRIEIGDTSVPGQEEAGVPGAQVQQARRPRKAKDALKGMQEEDAFELTPAALEGNLGIEHTRRLYAEERRKTRVKYVAFGAALVVLTLFSLCLSSQHAATIYSPAAVVASIGEWFKLTFTFIFHNANYQKMYIETLTANPTYSDTVMQMQVVFKYLACGALLALSGMLYQNAFKNPIAAPSMLGVTNGINAALLILVLQFGYEAVQHTNLYYVYSIIGGMLVLILVMLGGKWISGNGRFNTVNMILMGTIVSQLLGVLMQYVQTAFMDEQAWDAFYLLQNASGIVGPWMYGTLIIGGVAALVPVVLFRFKLNLISFSDEETRLLGVDPTKLRILALTCGSIMILVAQLNAGQVAMISLVIPFVVRAVFGSEFRKQLGGNLLMGALVLLLCGDLSTLIVFDGLAVGLGPVVSIAAVPLFVWMMAIRQRSWE